MIDTFVEVHQGLRMKMNYIHKNKAIDYKIRYALNQTSTNVERTSEFIFGSKLA